MSEIFRDRTEGAKAKRQELLRRRRDELVLTPHAVRRVVVARTARIAASVAVCLAGVALVIAAATPSLAAWVARGMPGPLPAPLSTILVASWLLAIACYSLARSVAEHRFAVAMSRYVLPGDDLDHDIERLSHEHPDELAREMAHRLEVRSAALPVAAAAAVLPATALYVALAWAAHGWPATADFEQALAGHGTMLAYTALCGLVASIAMTRRSARLPVVAPVAAGIASIATTLALASRAWFVAPAVIAATVAVIARRLRIERELIHAEDPAAGGEVFTLRGLIRGIRSAAAAVHAAASAHRGRIISVVGGIAALAVFGGRPPLARPDHAAATIPQPLIVEGSPRSAVKSRGEPSHDASTYTVTQDPGGLRIAMVFRDHYTIEVMGLGGLGLVPHGWRAHVSVHLEAASPPDAVRVTPFAGNMKVVARRMDSHMVDQAFDLDLCGDDRDQPLGLDVEPSASWAPGEHRLELVVSATLSLAGCSA